MDEATVPFGVGSGNAAAGVMLIEECDLPRGSAGR